MQSHIIAVPGGYLFDRQMSLLSAEELHRTDGSDLGREDLTRIQTHSCVAERAATCQRRMAFERRIVALET